MSQQPQSQPPQHLQQPSSQAYSSPQPSTPSIIFIIVAIIGALATIIAAIISKGPWSMPLPSTMVLVQNERMSSSTSTNTVTFHNPVTSGDLLVVAITQYGRQVLPLDQSGVKDNENDVFFLITSEIVPPNKQSSKQPHYVELYYARDAKGGATTVIVAFSQPADPHRAYTNVGIYEFSGLSGEEEEAAKSGPSTSSPTVLSAGWLNTTGSHDVCFAVGVDRGPFDRKTNYDPTIFPGKDYEFPAAEWNGQPDRQDKWQGAERFYTEYAPDIRPGGCKPNFKINYPASWAIIGAAFRP